jgi:hypothetical protein
MLYPRIYHVYTRHMREEYIYLVYTRHSHDDSRHIPKIGVPDVSDFQVFAPAASELDKPYDGLRACQ